MKTLKGYYRFIKENLNDNFNEYNSIIDYTSLTEKETEEDIISLCERAKILNVKSVCVYPKWVKTAYECLENTDVLITTVISFPEGNNSTLEKVSEAKKAINDGADEIDMVMDYKKLKEGDIEYVTNDIEKVVEEVHKHTTKLGQQTILKVIVESGELTEEETELSTNICIETGADFIKTSTGKVSIGAELDKVKIMFNTIKENNDNLKIKASGGIRTLEDMNTFLPYVDRFGMGFGSVDKINGLEGDQISIY